VDPNELNVKSLHDVGKDNLEKIYGKIMKMISGV
jgi:gamma-glutamylcysteine synthetase